MSSITCPGLPGEWVNGWLAAVGATVLDSRLRLSWTEDATPVAILTADDDDPVQILSQAWPRTEAVESLPLACEWRGVSTLGRKVPVEAFVQRARAARNHPQSWTLSSSLTDLVVDKNGEVEHAPFDPPVPRGIWLHDRLLRVHRRVDPSLDKLRDALLGLAVRTKDNGLGFDHKRLGSQSDTTTIRVDPVVESLAFFGLALFPVRGSGSDVRLGARGTGVIQRGWRNVGVGAGGGHEVRFQWPAWPLPLDRHGIDALLDIWRPQRKEWWPTTGVHAAWETVRYVWRGSADSTRAYGSRRL